MKKRKLALFQSAVSLLLCLSMLVGTTFAWFTDSVTTGINTIAAGNLDVELYHSNAAVTDERVGSATKLFMDLQGKPILWEPGAVSYENLRIANEGDLALVYQLALNTANENFVIDPTTNEQHGLSEVLKVGVVEGGVTATNRAAVVASVEDANWTTMADFVREGSLLPEGDGISEKTWGIVIYWEPGDHDNLWNLNNGKHLSEGEILSIDLGVSLIATQKQYESDSFGDDYDATAKDEFFPTFEGGTASVPVTPDADNKTAAEITADAEQVSAVVPAGVQLNDGVTELTLTVKQMNATGSNVILGENEAIRSLDVHIEGVADNNTVPITVTLKEAAPTGLNMGNYKLYHVENGNTVEMELVDSGADFTAHNQFKYDPATGDIVLYMATFSEVAVVADTESKWEGNVDHSWYDADATELTIANADQLWSFSQIVGGMVDAIAQDSFYGKTVKLVNDVNMGGADYTVDGKLQFYPIGYTKDGYQGAFSGTFDGTGHTISNIYQNTWMLVGTYDGTYYNAAMGLFGYVYGGKVCNLTIDNFNSEGEFAPTGCVAAYAANATFENIAITNSHPQTYNTSVAAVVGRDGKNGLNNNDGYNLIFKNITVDSSNTVSALWGSWDVGAAGLLGYLGSNSKVLLENCNVAATIDVYNDVCGNYQYYWYRYCGMLIGTVNKTKADGSLDLSNITAKNCTVDFGDRHEYYYCEFVENTIASYTHDYQMSRVDLTDIVGQGDSATCQNHNHAEHGTEIIDGKEVLVEDKQAVYIPFRQIFGGYGWGVKGTEITEEGIDIDDITVDWTSEPSEDDQVKFKSLFTGEFLYRVGNLNEIKISSLFDAVAGAEINDSGVYVRIDQVYDNSNVSCTFSPSTTDSWTDGTLKFEGTGVVDIVIQDFSYCTPTVLQLEVVDAKNATTATSATANNVVLLNDCGFSSVEVSGGYALFGNGFTMTCGSDSASTSFSQFVKLDSGTLDNVQIVCPNYDYAALYNSQLKDTDANRYETTNGTTRYYNAKSAVLVSGNSQILNSRISGGRAALYASSGNIVVDNTRLEGGAVATVIISGANSFVFRDVALIQKPTVSTHDSTKTLMGMSVLYLCDTDGNATQTTLEGSFVQNAWVDESSTAYMPTGTSSIADTVLAMTEYTHTVNEKTCVNLGFAYMPNDGTTVNKPSNIIDNRTDNESIPYSYANVNATIPANGLSVNISTYVYTYGNSGGTADSFKTDSGYASEKYSDIVSVTYSDTADGLTSGKTYGTNGWVYELNVDLDTASEYAFDFSKLSMVVNGVAVTDFLVNGSTKPTSPVTVTAGGTTYILTVTINGKTYSATYIVTGVETSKDAPTVVSSEYGTCLLVGEKSTSTTWSAAAPALEGIQIEYWSVAEKQYKKITLTDCTPTTSGQQNGTNTSWTYTADNSDFTLTITNTVAVHSGNGIYAMPVVCNSMLYFVITSSSGLVSTSSGSRSVTLKYEFADNNGGKLEFSHTFSASYDSNAKLYDYSEFCEGTLEEAECIVEGTLITMADGTQKPVEDLVVGDMVMVFNHITGKYEAMPLIFNTHADEIEAKNYDVLYLQFSDGKELKIVEAHGLFDMTLMQYVYINYDNYEDYIGHEFYALNSNGSGGAKVELTNAFIKNECVRVFCPVTYFHMNSFANGLLNTPSIPGDITGLVNYFEYDADLKYNEEAMQRDIEKYGLYSYEDFSDYISESAFDSSPAVFLKVAVGKGMITFEEILDVIEYLLAGSLIE